MSDVTTTSSPGAAVSPPATRGPEGVPASGDQAPARPSKVRRPRHSKPRFSSVTLFTTYLVLLLLIPSIGFMLVVERFLKADVLAMVGR